MSKKALFSKEEMFPENIFSKNEVRLGSLISGIVFFLLGLWWSIGIIFDYDLGLGIMYNVQISFPLLYGIGLIIGGVVLMIIGFKKLK